MADVPEDVPMVVDGVAYPTWGAFTRQTAAILLQGIYSHGLPCQDEAKEDLQKIAAEGCPLGPFLFQLERFTFRIEPQTQLSGRRKDADENDFIQIGLLCRVDNSYMSGVLLSKAERVAHYLLTGCALLKKAFALFNESRAGRDIYYLYGTKADRLELERVARNQTLAETLVARVIKRTTLKVGQEYTSNTMDLDPGTYQVQVKKRLFKVVKTAKLCTIHREK